LCHQVAILRRGRRRPQYTVADRALLAAASRLLQPERWSCFAVRPQTLPRWHRALLQGNRRQRGRGPGRPPLATTTRGLILRLARENPRWGYMRIQGELLQLGISVSATTVATVVRVSGLGPAPRRIGPSWSAFLAPKRRACSAPGPPPSPVPAPRATCPKAKLRLRRGQPREAEAAELSPNDAEVPWSSWRASDLPPLSAVAALPSPCDATAAPRRSSQQWHARDGPRTRGRSLHARTVRPRVKAGACTRAVCERNHSSGSPGPLSDSSPSRRSTTGRPRTEPSVEPSFFTPHPSARLTKRWSRAAAFSAAARSLRDLNGRAEPRRRRSPFNSLGASQDRTCWRKGVVG
jgi:hypothetical protein